MTAPRCGPGAASHDERRPRFASTSLQRISRRSIFKGAGALVGSGLLVACGGPATTSSNQGGNGGSKSITLSYGVDTLDVTSAWFAAIPRAVGFYNDEGLEVDVRGLKGGAASIQALVANRSQLATQSTEVIYSSVDGGEKLIGVMCQIPGTFIGIAVPADSPVRTETELKDALRGNTIGVNAVGSGPEMKVRAVLKRLGLTPEKDVKLLAVGTQTSALNALKSGRVAALGLWAMVYASFEAQGQKLRVFHPEPLPSLGFEHATVTMQKTIDDNPEMVQSYCRAIAKSLAFLSAVDHREVVKLHYEEYPATKPQGIPSDKAIDQGVHTLESLLPYMKLDERMKPGNLLGDVADFRIESVAKMLQGGDLIKEVKEPSAYFTRQFLKKANDFDRDEVVARAKKFKV